MPCIFLYSLHSALELLNNINEWHRVAGKEVISRDVEVGVLWVLIKDIIVDKSLATILSGIDHIIKEFLAYGRLIPI